MKLVERFLDRALRRNSPELADLKVDQLQASLDGERRRKAGEYAGFCALYVAANAPIIHAGLVHGQFPLLEGSIGIGANILAGTYGMVIAATTGSAIDKLQGELHKRSDPALEPRITPPLDSEFRVIGNVALV